MAQFTVAKQEFDSTLGTMDIIPHSIVTVDGKAKDDIVIKNTKHERIEEYYKWQFIYALVNSVLFVKDYIGAEVRFPKGSKTSAPLKMDGAIFDDASWLIHYSDYWQDRKSEDLEWLNAHLMAVIEFKKNDKEIEKVFTGQVKPAMREKEPGNAYVLGMYYDAERLYLFHRREGLILRYDEAKNQKGDASKVGDLSLYLPDPYYFIPSFGELKTLVHKPSTLDRSKRNIGDLDTITSIATVQIQTALSEVLRALDRAGLVNQRGYEILIQAFALKISDEKRNSKNPVHNLELFSLMQMKRVCR